MENRKSVLLADASEEFRHLFAGALAEEDDIVLIGETGDGQEAVRLAREQQPDVMVMDLVLSRMDGLEVLQALAGQSPGRGCWCSPALPGATWLNWRQAAGRITI